MQKILTKQYQQIYNRTKLKVREFYEKLNFNSKMTPEQRFVEANKYGRLKLLEEEITNFLGETNAEAVKEINGRLGKIYEINYNFIAEPVSEINPINLKEGKEEAKDTISPFQSVAVDKLKDKGQIKTGVANQLITAILQGASLGVLYNGIKKVIEQNLNSTATISINATTRTENIARTDAGEKIKSYYPVKKQWVAIIDSKTRDAHAVANGQIVDIDKPFLVGGEELQYPGDISGSLANIINCRCTTKFIFDKDK